MEFEDQEEHEDEEEIELPPSYGSLGNSSRPKMPGLPGVVDAPPRRPRYRECLKNHAVGLGGHAVDGCGEFLPSGADGTLDALKCAACNCHRNFHRKETDTAPVVGGSGSGGGGGGGGGGEGFNFHQPHHFLLAQHPHGQQFSPSYYRTPSGYLHVAAAHHHHQRPLALPSTSGGGGSQSRDDEDDMSNPTNTSVEGGSSKKRFRTKFTPDQKDRMLELAERLGWRIQKQDEAVVQQFCHETGVKRHVLKVWMHNNKHTLGKKP